MIEFAIKIKKWEEMTEKQVLAEDWDMIPTLTAFAKTREFCQVLEDHRIQLEELISRHLGVPPSDFVLLDQEYWFWGSFNVCLPIDIENTRRASRLPRQALLRFALPFRCGEDYSPGNVEEKLRCEAATYIWLQRSHPSIPTPQLLGMGFPDAESFTAVEHETSWHRFVWQFRRCRAWLRGETLSPFFRHERSRSLSKFGYLLLEHVKDCSPLSSTWQEHRTDENRLNNLYRGLSSILLDLASIPLPRIGSWTLDRRGAISLTNRPLFDLTMLWNRHGIPTGIPRDLTYTSADSYFQDVLSYQDNRIRHQPNAILGRPDGVYQLSALTALRALLPIFRKQSVCSDNFVLTLPDLHQSNILVDDEWNIVSIIDFEFAPVQPQQVVGVPHWLTDKSVDQLNGPDLKEYQNQHDLFVDILAQGETLKGTNHSFSQRLKEDWRTGRLWYNNALRSSNGFPLVFEHNIQPRYFVKFEDKVEGEALMKLWSEDCEDFIAQKLKDNERYKERIHTIFVEAEAEAKAKAEAEAAAHDKCRNEVLSEGRAVLHVV